MKDIKTSEKFPLSQKEKSEKFPRCQKSFLNLQKQLERHTTSWLYSPYISTLIFPSIFKSQHWFLHQVSKFQLPSPKEHFFFFFSFLHYEYFRPVFTLFKLQFAHHLNNNTWKLLPNMPFSVVMSLVPYLYVLWFMFSGDTFFKSQFLHHFKQQYLKTITKRPLSVTMSLVPCLYILWFVSGGWIFGRLIYSLVPCH